jgi:hypothetical protein
MLVGVENAQVTQINTNLQLINRLALPNSYFIFFSQGFKLFYPENTFH